MLCIWWANFSSPLCHRWSGTCLRELHFHMAVVTSFGPGHICSVLTEWMWEDWGFWETAKSNLYRIRFRGFWDQLILCQRTEWVFFLMHFSSPFWETTVYYRLRGTGQRAADWESCITGLSAALHTCWKGPLDTETEPGVWSWSTVSTKGLVQCLERGGKKSHARLWGSPNSCLLHAVCAVWSWEGGGFIWILVTVSINMVMSRNEVWIPFS